jgi:vitamin B12 transporter
LAQAGLSQRVGDWDTGMQWRYTGARTDNAQTLKSYAVLDLTASQALTPELRLNLRLENAGNANYQTIYGYNMPKRGVFAGLKWTPKF